ncbi:hypothetical protein KQX54_001876 [Cotesia glomerata]|uniref:Uncharacterized protein n=1 Tax=Cotesia glomerata TaxID=32391 RepID=A0AAV7ILN3_COTGL|nr:hypothetical protein KQX54_001876 [Cotesia glomerata]
MSDSTSEISSLAYERSDISGLVKIESGFGFGFDADRVINHLLAWPPLSGQARRARHLNPEEKPEFSLVARVTVEKSADPTSRSSSRFAFEFKSRPENPGGDSRRSAKAPGYSKQFTW